MYVKYGIKMSGKEILKHLQELADHHAAKNAQAKKEAARKLLDQMHKQLNPSLAKRFSKMLSTNFDKTVELFSKILNAFPKVSLGWAVIAAIVVGGVFIGKMSVDKIIALLKRGKSKGKDKE